MNHSRTPKTALALYQAMLRIRMVELEIAKRYAEQKMRCPVHLSVGQEGAAVGVCAALHREDAAFSTHRSHGHYLAKGGNLNAMIGELHGKSNGCCGGRGGSMHLYDTSAGMHSSVPIVGSNIPLAVGAALSFKQRRLRNCAVAFLGDGAAEEGVFHESLNFAKTQNLPVLFVLENNLYSVYTPLSERQPNLPLTRFADAHGISARKVNGSDVVETHQATLEALAHIDKSEGPQLLVIDTYRYHAHCGPEIDDDLGYRPQAEVTAWQGRCPVETLEARLNQSGELDARSKVELVTAIESEISDAFDAAYLAPLPDPSSAEHFVYASKHSKLELVHG